MNQTYYANGNQIFVRMVNGKDLLFLTVHPNNGANITPEEQAEHLAVILNDI